MTLEHIYDAFTNLGFLYDTSTGANKTYKMTALPVSVTNPINTNIVPQIYSGMAYAIKEPDNNGYYKGFVVSYMNEDGFQDFSMKLGSGSIVYCK
jgi:hypothetical protein